MCPESLAQLPFFLYIASTGLWDNNIQIGNLEKPF
jgi:hypothetical protein